MATLAGGAKFIADLKDEEPHLLIAAGTGGGKTSAAHSAPPPRNSMFHNR